MCVYLYTVYICEYVIHVYVTYILHIYIFSFIGNGMAVDLLFCVFGPHNWSTIASHDIP